MVNKFVLIFILFLFSLTNTSTAIINKEEVMNTDKPVVMIDLDGVLDSYTKYTDEIPPIKEGAKEFIVKLSKDYELILFTTRSPKLATKWLIDNKIDEYFKDVTNVKIPAYIYVDDRAISFNGNYDETFKEIKRFKAYWRK